MIINLHMEKAGGTSVRRFFEKALGRMYFRVLSHDLNRSMLELKRYQNKYLIAHGHVFYGVHSELGCEPLYETVLRNPLDRFYSQYKHVTSRVGSPIFKQFGNMDYSAFLDKYGERFGNIQTRRICGKLDEEPLDLSDLRLAIKRLKHLIVLEYVRILRRTFRVGQRSSVSLLPSLSMRIVAGMMMTYLLRVLVVLCELRD